MRSGGEFACSTIQRTKTKTSWNLFRWVKPVDNWSVAIWEDFQISGGVKDAALGESWFHENLKVEESYNVDISKMLLSLSIDCVISLYFRQEILDGVPTEVSHRATDAASSARHTGPGKGNKWRWSKKCKRFWCFWWSCGNGFDNCWIGKCRRLWLVGDAGCEEI